MPSPWRTVKEGAARARVHPSVIYREVKAGRLRAVRIGGRRDLRLRDEYIDEWLESSLKPVELPVPFRFGNR